MAANFPENTYSFRAYTSVLADFAGVAPPDATLVSEIEAALLEASQDYSARNYRGTIDAYQTAQALIYAQLDSSCVFGVVKRLPDVPRDASLFDPLLSSALEWMNVLPVAGPVSPVRPRVTVPAAPIASVTALEGVGLANPDVSTATGMEAAADLHFSETLSVLSSVWRRASRSNPS